MELIAAINFESAHIERIISHRVERTGTCVDSIKFYGVRSEGKLHLECILNLTTRQGDPGLMRLDHEQILGIFNEHLSSIGYKSFTESHRIYGDDDDARQIVSNIAITVFYDINTPID